MTKDSIQIGALVKEKRDAAGMSVRELAIAADCTDQTIYNIEKGLHDIPPLLAVLCELKVNLGEL